VAANAAYELRTELSAALYRPVLIGVQLDETGFQVTPVVRGSIGGRYRIQVRVTVPSSHCEVAAKLWDVDLPKDSTSLCTHFQFRDLDPRLRRCVFRGESTAGVGFAEKEYAIECSVMADQTHSVLANKLLARDEIMRVRSLGTQFVRRDFDI
jgi:hypothetical protein